MVKMKVVISQGQAKMKVRAHLLLLAMKMILISLVVQGEDSSSRAVNVSWATFMS